MPGTRLGLAVCTLLAGVPLPQDLVERFWNQPRGNAEGTAAVDVEPVRSDPVELWRLELGEVLCEPVVWGETLYVAVEEQRTRTLHAISIADGESIAQARLGSHVDFTHLAAWQGTVVAVEPEEVETYTHRASSFKMSKRVKSEAGAPPCVARGYLFTTSRSGELACIDIVRGKLVARRPGAGYGRPTVSGERVVALDVGPQPGYAGDYLALITTSVQGLGGREVALDAPFALFSGMVQGPAIGRKHEGYVLALGEADLFYGRSPAPLLTAGGGTCPGALLLTNRLSTIATPPTVYGGQLFGFDEDGALVGQYPDGRYRNIVTLDELPAGARAGPATRARSVAYLGNWAVDLDSRRVLWCLPELDAKGPLLPVADGRIAYVSTSGAVVCLGGRDPDVAANPAGSEPEGRPTRPGTGDAVVLDDGTRLPGAVERGADGSFRLVSEGAPPRELEASRVSLVEAGDAVELVGREYPLLLAWTDALDAEVVEVLAERFEGYLEGRLVADCRRLLAEMRERGLSGRRADGFEARLAGLSQSTASNARLKQARQREGEEAERRELATAFAEASAWCSAKGFATTATVLLAEAGELCPELEDRTARVAALVPPGFPWRDADDAAERWSRWARELAPADARFLDRDEVVAQRGLGESLWADGALALATPNLVVLSRADDPETIGACLRNGEAAVRALEGLLGRSSRREPFEVRIHANREEYLLERAPDGSLAAAPWSSGYYSPLERVSRFFVQRSEESLEPLQRKLHKIFAHELTHQYLAQAWLPAAGTLSGAPDQPGYWVQEGIARFIEDQVVEMARRGQRFDDATVKSVDAVSQLAEAGKLIPMRTFLELSHEEFVFLEDELVAEVQLQNTLARIGLSMRSIFYEQAGSLVFFLYNRDGPEGRAALAEYLRAAYERRMGPEGWKLLGFGSVEELDREFRAFLGGLR